MYRTQYDRVEIFTNPGSPVKPVFKARIDKDGKRVIVKKGDENLYSYIQSFAESCDINIILKKFMATGDATLLTQRHSEFLDLTDMPRDKFEMINQINDAREQFNSLPVDVKAKFDNDADKFIATIGTMSWFEKLGFVDKNNDGVIDKKDIEIEKKEGELNA